MHSPVFKSHKTINLCMFECDLTVEEQIPICTGCICRQSPCKDFPDRVQGPGSRSAEFAARKAIFEDHNGLNKWLGRMGVGKIRG